MGNQHSLKYFGTNSHWNIPFSCVVTAHITPKATQYSVKYFGTNNCRNIPFSCVLTAHMTSKAKNILQNTLAPATAKIFHFDTDSVHMFPGPQTIFPGIFHPEEPTLFSHVLSEHITEAKIIFSKIFWHQWLRKDFIFTVTQCTCFRAANSIFWNKSVLRAAEILHFHVYQVHLLFQTLNNILWNFLAPTPEVFHFHMYGVHILWWSQNNILRNISAPTATAIFHFHMYWVHILWWRQNNILWNISAPTAAKRFYFHTDSVQMFLSCKQYSLEYFGTKSCQNISFSHVLSAPITPKANQYSPKHFGPPAAEIFCSCGFSAHTTSMAREYSLNYFCTNNF